MSKLTEAAYSEDEIKTMWLEEMKKREGCSNVFRAMFEWMFDYEEFAKVMRLAHLPNPCLRMVSKK